MHAVQQDLFEVLAQAESWEDLCDVELATQEIRERYMLELMMRMKGRFPSIAG